MHITIDEEFRSIIPTLTQEEFKQLEANILTEGCRDPLALWLDAETYILIDGHHRHAICTKHNIPYETTIIDLPDRNTVADWIDANQLGRRNLTSDQASLLRGRRYNRVKKAHGGNRKSSPQNKGLKTAETLAAQHGVSRATIERDGQYARAVEKVKKAAPDIGRKIITGQGPSKSAVVAAAEILETEPEKAHAVLQGKMSVPLLKAEIAMEKKGKRKRALRIPVESPFKD